MQPERRAELYRRFETAVEVPMLLLSGVFVAVIAAPLIAPIKGEERTILDAIDWAIWALFAIELTIKTYLAPRRLRYLYSHWYDVVVVAVPFLRPLRAIRALRGLRGLELLRLGSVFAQLTHSARSVLQKNGLQYVLLVAAILVVGAAATETMVERSAHGNIRDFGTGLWWAVETVTTVGYGDTHPTTAAGRGVAVVLMLVTAGTSQATLFLSTSASSAWPYSP